MSKLLDIFRHSRTAPEDLSKELQTVRESALFDSNWYREQNPDIGSDSDPALHYLKIGAAEGRNPSAVFDGNWYLARYPDVAASRQNPLLHYLEFGRSEGREIRPVSSEAEAASLFDAEWYLGRHPELRNRAESPLLHFQKHASKEERELLRQAEQIAASEYFDPAWYRERYRASLENTAIHPALHFLIEGAAAGFHPGPKFDAQRYLQFHPDVAEANPNALLHYLASGASEGRQIAALSASEKAGVPTVSDLIQKRLNGSRLLAFPLPRDGKRITLVLDRIDTEPAASSLVLAALLSDRTGAPLRLITQEKCSEDLNTFFARNAVAWNGRLELVHSPAESPREFPVSENDFFLVNSCRTARAARVIAKPSRILFLVQDDERLSYPYGDERLRCEEILGDPDITFAVESQLLFKHLAGIHRGTWFEPALPFRAAERKPGGKRRFIFYADSNNPAHLPWRGLEAIEAAIESDILRPAEWDFCFAGRSPLDALLLGDTRPKVLSEPLSDLSADVAVSLVYSPHPGHPVLQLAANGAAVVTSRCGVKQSLSHYSPNILCVEPTVDGIKEGLREALKISERAPVNLPPDWNRALETVLQEFERVLAGRS